jgi:hypothetical protein
MPILFLLILGWVMRENGHLRNIRQEKWNLDRNIFGVQRNLPLVDFPKYF